MDGPFSCMLPPPTAVERRSKHNAVELPMPLPHLAGGRTLATNTLLARRDGQVGVPASVRIKSICCHASSPNVGHPR